MNLLQQLEAEEVTRLTKAQITQQTSTTMAMFANHNPAKMMELLFGGL